MEIYSVRVPEKIDEDLFKSLLQFVEDSKKNRIEKLVIKKYKYKVLFSELLIRMIICDKLNLKNNQILIKKNEYGKPFLVNCEKFHFNISHSGEWIVCAVDNNVVGIDIEKISIVDYCTIARTFFNKEESSFIFQGCVDEHLKNFYTIWTLKESYIKADGRGLSLPLKSFTIHIDRDRNIRLMKYNILKNCFFKEFHIDLDYKISVCCSKNNFSSKIITITQNQLINRFIN